MNSSDKNSTEWNNAILEMREALAERERLSRALESAERTLNEARRNMADLALSLRKEDEDVRRLEGASLVGLFYAVMGTKEERLDEERQELLAAKLKQDAARGRVTALEKDIEGLHQQLNRIGGAETLQARYEALLAEKERRLAAENHPTGQRLLQLNHELAGLRSTEREVQEAIQAGEAARAGLDSVAAMLDSAGSWGTLDLLGGGMIVSAIKHSKLDEAHAAVADVQPLLQRFERELADVSEMAGLQFEAGGLTAFADIFIDNLLIDLFVQSRIHETREAAEGMLRQVDDLLTRLAKKRTEISRQAQAMAAERQNLLEQGSLSM